VSSEWKVFKGISVMKFASLEEEFQVGWCRNLTLNRQGDKVTRRRGESNLNPVSFSGTERSWGEVASEG
jgi:hypothetical protein